MKHKGKYFLGKHLEQYNHCVNCYLAAKVSRKISERALTHRSTITTSCKRLWAKLRTKPTKTYCKRFSDLKLQILFSKMCTPNLLYSFIVNLAVNNLVLRKFYETHRNCLKAPKDKFFYSQGFDVSSLRCFS